MNTDSTEQIEVLAQNDSTSYGLWRPIRGPESEHAVRNFPDEDGRGRLLAESAAVLSQCVPPDRLDTRTGLVVGYVQSGKTLSFTTVTALARDNGFRLVIVIAGSSVPLFKQSGERLKGDLGPLDYLSAWVHFDSDELSSSSTSRTSIRTELEAWENEEVPEDERRAVLLTVMKNGAHLDRVTTLLCELGPLLKHTPTLIIDDEADQASLNTRVNTDEESATYRRIGEIRALLPQHTYLQYTATPQAPLLINIIDALSPDFAEVLTPGEAYTGGQAFFHDQKGIVREIPHGEIVSDKSLPPSPPASLLEALQLFFLGVAVGELTSSRQSPPSPRHRSMMMHPSHRTNTHQHFVRWVQSVKDHWLDVLAGKQTERDREDVLALFQRAYNDLSQTVNVLPPFKNLVQQLPHSIRKTRVWEMNARDRKTPTPNWSKHYSHILVGGQALDRGFTVEGLTVAYMPRGLGVGNADTFQQRARWFGYKEDYIGYCRIFLSAEGKYAYRQYLDHEEYVRKSLRKHGQTGKPLREWKRAFILDKRFQPTRRAVLDLDYGRFKFGDLWLDTKSPHDVNEAVSENRNVVGEFLGGLTLHPDEGHHERLPSHQHRVARNVPLRRVMEEFLSRLRFPSATDSPPFTALQLRLEQHIERYPAATCTIFQMRPGEKSRRGTTNKGQISQLFQGAYPVSGKDKIYPGDREIKAAEGVTIQLHRVDVFDGKVSDGDLLQSDVPVVAVWVPKELTQDWLVQSPPTEE